MLAIICVSGIGNYEGFSLIMVTSLSSKAYKKNAHTPKPPALSTYKLHAFNLACFFEDGGDVDRGPGRPTSDAFDVVYADWCSYITVTMFLKKSIYNLFCGCLVP